MSDSPSSRWVVSLSSRVSARLRLFCFPYAGGGVSTYRKWPSAALGQVHLCAVQLPGRENRLGDPPLTQAPQLVNVLREELQPYFDIPFAFFGHSMGALIAFELARKLRQSGGPMPVRLFLSGRRAPHLPPSRPPIHHLPDEEFRHEVRLLQGTPEEVLGNEELMQIILPVLRADFAVCETYAYSAEEPLAMPLSVFGSNHDPEVNHDELEAWRSQTTGSMSLRIFEGNHFFLHPMRLALTDAIAHDISALPDVDAPKVREYPGSSG